MLYGHAVGKSDENWAKKSIEFRVYGRKPVGRSRMLCLENVEADMADFEIDKEDIQKEVWKECYEEGVQPFRTTDYKPIIYINVVYADNIYCK